MHGSKLLETHNKKQCSRQLQCEFPCSVRNVVNSSLFINSSLSSLSFTSHAVTGGGGCLASGRGGGFCLQQGDRAPMGEGGPTGGGGPTGEGAGDISVQLPYTALPHGASP